MTKDCFGGIIIRNIYTLKTEKRNTVELKKIHIPLPPKILAVPLFFLLVMIIMSVGTSAAEEFTADNIELSSSSSKDVEYTITADAQTTFWAANFTVHYDSDIMSLRGVEADSGFVLDYTNTDNSVTILLHKDAASNVSLKKGQALVKLKFRVSDKIQPGEYSLSFSYPKNSMVTYNGGVRNMHISGGTLFYGNRVTYVRGNSTLGSEFAAAGDTIYPAQTCASTNPDEIFVGWYAKKTSYHKKIFLAPGEGFVIGNHDVTLEAVFLEIKTLSGASVYFAQEDNDVRLRYISAVNKEQYNFIFNEILGKDSASMILGTLICPTRNAESNAEYGNNGGMTFEALKNDRLAVQTSVPKAPGLWLSGSALDNIGASSKYYYYDGILNNIIRKNASPISEDVIDYNTDFSAIAYLTLTYPSGQTVDYFAKYDAEKHSRSVSYVVTRALADVSAVKTDYYRFKIDDVYRPYSSAQMESLYRIKANID